MKEQRNAAALLRVGQRLNDANTREQAARIILEISEELFGWDACALDLYTPDTGQLWPIINIDTIDGKKTDCSALYVGVPLSPLARQIIQDGPKLILRHPPFAFGNSMPFGNTGRPSASIMYVPIRSSNQVVGLLSIHSYSPDAYKQADLDLLQSLADHCSGALERIRSREALIRSEQLVRTLSQSSPLAILQHDSQGKLTYANARWIDISGMSIEDSLGFGWTRAIDPAEHQRLWITRLHQQAPPYGWSDEHRLVNHGNKPRWVRFLITPISSPEGLQQGFISTIEDITQRKRAELITAAFSKLGESLSSVDSAREAAQVIASAADDLLGWDVFFLDLFSADSEHLFRVLCYDIIAGQRQEVPWPKPFDKSDSYVCKQLKAKSRIILRSPPLAFPENAYRFGDTSRPSASLLFVSIRHRDQVIGFLSIQSYAFNAYDKPDLDTLQALADHCGGALVRLRTQEALHISEMQLRLVWESTLDGMRLIDANGMVVAVNAAYCRLVGMPKEALLGQPFSIVYRDADQQKVLEHHLTRFPSRNSPALQEHELVWANGKTCYAEVFHAYLDVEGQPPLLLTVFRDVTARKQIEKRNIALSKLTGNLSIVSTPADAARVIRDITDELFGWDAFTVALCGPEPDTVVPLLYIDTMGGKREEILPAYISSKASERARLVLAGPQLILKQGPLTMSPDAEAFGDKSRPSASIMGVPIRNGTQVVGLISVQSYSYNAYTEADLQQFQAIADQCGGALDRIRSQEAFKHLEEQLRQSQKMESIGQLAGGIAHDFNNLLTVIQGHTILLQDAQLPAEYTESLQQIAAAVERSANLTRQLLTFSRRQVMQTRDLDLNEIVANMTKLLRRILGEDISLQMSCSLDPLLVRADPGMIEQVLLNLAVNSRDAMPKGGKLLISTSICSIDSAYVHSCPDAREGNFIRLTVEDCGCGIPAQHLPHIFEPFFTTKETGKGTGLGLATVYGVVKQHEGWITVSSIVGKGTTFDIFLPQLKKQTQVSTVPVIPQSHGGTETILAVEDETAVRQLIGLVLRRNGYTVYEAKSGVACMELWRQHASKIDLLLTDLVLPDGLSGRELAQRLQSEKPGLRIIYTSGYSPEIAGKGLHLRDGLDFIQKPYRPEKLVQTIRACLDQH